MTKRITGCRTGLGGRLTYGIITVFLAAFAGSTLHSDPVIAIAAGVGAILVAIMAVTGWCPGASITVGAEASTTDAAAPNTLGIPDARQYVNLTPRMAPPTTRSDFQGGSRPTTAEAPDQEVHTMPHHSKEISPDPGPRHFWEAKYRETDRAWSGRVNPALAGTVQRFAPGRALDLGCGEGADAIWLATQGWTVTGVDISDTAIARARREADQQQVSTTARFVRADIAQWEPDDGPYDLVTASFLHSPIEFPRTSVLQRAATAVAPRGHLLIISHAAPPPWVDHAKHPGHQFTSPAQEFVELGLDAHQWLVVTAETRSRETISPAGEPSTLEDGILLIRRR